MTMEQPSLIKAFGKLYARLLWRLTIVGIPSMLVGLLFLDCSEKLGFQPPWPDAMFFLTAAPTYLVIRRTASKYKWI